MDFFGTDHYTVIEAIRLAAKEWSCLLLTTRTQSTQGSETIESSICAILFAAVDDSKIVKISRAYHIDHSTFIIDNSSQPKQTRDFHE
jgi:hypothetical protein